MFPTTTTLTSLLLLFISTLLYPAHAQTCHLDRDTARCTPPKGLTQLERDFFCLRKLNTLTDIMDCVKIDRRKQETDICRARDDGDPKTDNEDFSLRDGKADNFCFNPRAILVEGTAELTDSQDDSIRGALKACPMSDPDFHNCLCRWAVSEKHLSHFARHFKKDVKQDFSCGLAKKKRDVVPSLLLADFDQKKQHDRRDRAAPRSSSAPTITRAPPRPSTFSIRNGRPVYPNGVTGWQLPFVDQFVSAGAAKRRCYLHPEDAVIASCYTWKLASAVTTAAVSVWPSKANFSTPALETGSVVQPSRTEEPATEALPAGTAQGDVQGGAAGRVVVGMGWVLGIGVLVGLGVVL